jgi:dihydroneopterin aldolase
LSLPFRLPSRHDGVFTATAQAEPMDLVLIEGFRADTVIGIHHGEDVPQPLVIDVHAGVPHARACDTDDIRDTIDYSVVRTRLLRLAAEHRLHMLEAFAEAIADILLDEFGASWVRVRVVKPNKFADVQSLGVQIERAARPLQPPAGIGRSAAVLQLLGSGMVPGSR